MPEFPRVPLLGGPLFAINPQSVWSLGPQITATYQVTAWPAANDALYVPFRLPEPATCFRMACGTGTGTTGNFDLGIYDWLGNRLVSAGSTARTTASSERIVDVTDTLLLPGRYYLAMAASTTDTYTGWAASNLYLCKLLGMRRQGTALALPATATFATCNSTVIPAVCAYFRSEA